MPGSGAREFPTKIPSGHPDGWSLSYFFEDTAAAPPGTGAMRFNSATLSSVTHVYIHKTESNGVDVAAALALMAGGDSIRIFSNSFPAKFGIFTVAQITVYSTYVDFFVQYVSGNGPMVNGWLLGLGWAKRGRRGKDGPEGPRGLVGARGASSVAEDDDASDSTSSTTFVDTGCQVVINLPEQRLVQIRAFTTANRDATYAVPNVAITIDVNGTDYGIQYAVGIGASLGQYHCPMSICKDIVLAAGSHTITLQFKAANLTFTTTADIVDSHLSVVY